VSDAQRPRRPAAAPILLAFAAAFVLTQAADQGLVLAVARARSGGNDERFADEAAVFVRSMAGMSIIPVLNGIVLASLAVALASVESLRRGGSAAARLRLARPERALGSTIAATVGVLGLSLACGAVIDLLGVQAGDTMDVMADAFRAPAPWQLALSIVAVGFVPGVAEEVFFRGFVLEGLAESWGAWPGILVSAAAFGLIHVEPVQASAAFVVGVFFGWSALRFGSIRPAMIAHAANNAAFLLMVASGWDETASRARVLGTLAVGTVLCASAIAWIRMRGPRRDLTPNPLSAERRGG
jgi:membrane protease YdiL (CAAX protease family)